VERSQGDLAKQAPERVRKGAARGHSAFPKAQRAGPSGEQMDLGEGWNHVVLGGEFQGHNLSTPNPNPKPTPQPVTKLPRQPNVTATRKMAGPKKPDLNPQQKLNLLL